MDKETLKKVSEKYAESQEIMLNPNKIVIDAVLNGLLKNQKEYGIRYCPCVRINTKDKKDNRICPCKPSKKEIEEKGYCHCMFFVSKDFNEQDIMNPK